MRRAAIASAIILTLIGCGDNSNLPSPWAAQYAARSAALEAISERCGANAEWAADLHHLHLTIDVQRALTGKTVAFRCYVMDLAAVDGTATLTVETMYPRVIWRLTCEPSMVPRIRSRVDSVGALFVAARIDEVRTAQELAVYEFLDPEWQSTPLAIGTCVGVASAVYAGGG